MKLGISKDISNSQYHAQLSPEEHFFSSSQLKDMLDDPETFKKKYITRELEANKSIPAFDIGTYFHTAILEPHLLKEECVVWDGKARRGKVWDEFQELHKGKAIITKSEYELAKNLIVATQNSEIAMDLHKGGEAEVSLGIEIYTDLKSVYVLTNSKSVYRLDVKKGWDLYANAPTCLENMVKVRLKVRCDYINAKKGYIADLKSTTGNAKDAHKTRNKISSYQYDLSAALYVDLFNARFISEGKKYRLTTFWWVFASKDYSNCQCYWTGIGPQGEVELSNLQVGRAKWIKAVCEIGKYQNMEWEIPEEPRSLAAQPWEMEWIDKGDSDNTTKFSNNKTKVKQQEIGVDLL